MVKENATTVTLTGSEVTVEFDKNYTYFWLNNIGDSAVYASMKPDVTADKDGVITILSGTAAGTMHGYGADKLYLNGSGKVQVIGTYSAFCPFRVGAKGGDGGGTSEFSAAGSATQPVYFDADGRPVAISHTIESNVPANAVFTDTVYDDEDISDRVTELETDLGGHTVKTNVPENAVFTDTTYGLSASKNAIVLTDSNGTTAKVEAILTEKISVAAGETVVVLPEGFANHHAQLKLLAAYDPGRAAYEYAWYDGKLTAIGNSSISGFTKNSYQGQYSVLYTAPTDALACSVYVFHFIKFY